jgi:transposase
MSHPYFVRRLTARERREIDELVRKSPRVAVFLRAKAVQLSADGWKTRDIATAVERDRTAVVRWLHRFDEEGLDALEPRKSSGRPPKADEAYRTELKEAAATNPCDLAYPFTRWTLGRLREHLKRKTGIDVDASRISRLLKAIGYRYGRPKLDLKHRQDPQQVATAKRLRTRALKKRAKNPTDAHSSTSMKLNST